MNANTRNSYSEYLSSPVTCLKRICPLLIVKAAGNPAEPLFLKNNLNPVMTPFLESAGGNCQDAVILVELLAVTEKLLGAFEGTAVKRRSPYVT